MIQVDEMDEELKIAFCTECDYKCKKSKMLFHMLRDHSRKCYVCPKCSNNEFFESESLLTQHIKDIHDNAPTVYNQNCVFSKEILRHFEINEDKNCNIKLSNSMKVKNDNDSVSFQTNTFSCEFTMLSSESKNFDCKKNMQLIFCGICDVNETASLVSDSNYSKSSSDRDADISIANSNVGSDIDVNIKMKYLFSRGEDAIIFDLQYIWLYNVKIVGVYKEYNSNVIRYRINYKGYSDQYNTTVDDTNLFKASDGLILKNRMDALDNFKMDLSTKYFYETLEDKVNIEDNYEISEKVFVYYKRLFYHGEVIAIKRDNKLKGKQNFIYKIHFDGWSNDWDEWVPLKRVFKWSEITACIHQKQWQQVELREQNKRIVKTEPKKKKLKLNTTSIPQNNINKCRLLIDYIEERSDEVWVQCPCGQWYHKSCTGLEGHSNFDYDTFSCLFVDRKCDA